MSPDMGLILRTSGISINGHKWESYIVVTSVKTHNFIRTIKSIWSDQSFGSDLVCHMDWWQQYVHMGIPRYELNIDDIRSPYSGKKGSPTSRSVSQWCQNSDLTVMSEQSYILVSDVRTLIIIWQWSWRDTRTQDLHIFICLLDRQLPMYDLDWV